MIDLTDHVAQILLAEYNVARMKKLPPHLLGSQRQLVKNINYFANLNSEIEQVPIQDVMTIAAMLIEELTKVAKSKKLLKVLILVPEFVDGTVNENPAFEHAIDGDFGYLRLNPALDMVLDDEVSIREFSQTKHLPMVIPPKAWTEFNKGGYLTLSAQMMRTRGSKVQNHVLKEADLESVFDSLNVLNQTPWVVNTDVFQVVKHIWENGGGIGDLPSRANNVIPTKPRDVTKEELTEWKRKSKKLKTENRNLHSLRCDLIHKLRVAEDLANEQFYFPHNVDFRGRAYPIPPHLNHLGSDLNRGMLKFSKSAPIGKQ
jgi:DNA-directed RNA polymerase